MTAREWHYRALLLLFSMLGLFWFYRIGDCRLWIDEFFSLNIAQRPLELIWSMDSHPNKFYFNTMPPLYETILHFFWDTSGQNLFLPRLLSLVFTALAIFLLFKLTALLFDKTTAVYAALWATLNASYLLFAQMIRGYAFLNALAIASAYLFFRMIKTGDFRKRWLAMLLAVNVCILYTSYFGALVIFMEIFFSIFLFRDRVNKIINVWLAGAFLFFIPWGKHFLEDVGREPALNKGFFLDGNIWVGMLGRFEKTFNSLPLFFLYMAVFVVVLVYGFGFLKKKTEQGLWIVSLALFFLIPTLAVNWATFKVYGHKQFVTGDVNVGLLQKTLRHDSLSNNLIREKLAVGPGALDRVTERDFITALNDILKMRDFHTRVNAGIYKPRLLRKTQKMLENASEENAVLPVPALRAMNRALLEIIYPREIQKSQIYDPMRMRYSLVFLFPLFIFAAVFIRKFQGLAGGVLLAVFFFCSLAAVFAYSWNPKEKFGPPADIGLLAEEARSFSVPAGDRVDIEIETDLYVPIFVYYFYGPEHFREVSFPNLWSGSKSINHASEAYKLYYNIACLERGVLRKNQIESVGCNWDLVSKQLVQNGWATPISSAEVALQVDLSKDQDRIEGVFGTDYYKIQPVFQKTQSDLVMKSVLAEKLWKGGEIFDWLVEKGHLAKVSAGEGRVAHDYAAIKTDLNKEYPADASQAFSILMKSLHSHFLRSVFDLKNTDWLFLLYADWNEFCWGKSFPDFYKDRMESAGFKGRLDLVRQKRVGEFVLEIYKVNKD